MNWKPTRIDLIISTAMAVGFPLLAGFLFRSTGALLPMVLYYGAAWGIAKVRRGSTGYSLRNLPAPPVWFWVHIGVIGVTVFFAYLARISVPSPNIGGVIATALVWAVVNAASEQLLWLYIFDAWDLYARERLGKAGRVVCRLMGLLLFTAYVAAIHTMYWAKFLHTVDPQTIFGILFVVATSVSGYLHIVVWRQGGRMIYTFIPHYLLNLVPLFWTGYSVLPYLVE